MLERICPSCHEGNELEAIECVHCRTTLQAPLARRPAAGLSRAVPALPTRWQQAGKAAALGVVALAVEAGAVWLQHRAAQKPMPLARASSRPETGQRSRVVARQRVWETYEGGSLTHRVVEQTVWHLPDDPGS